MLKKSGILTMPKEWQDILNYKSGDLIGILNGVNYHESDPEKDDLIYSKYNKDWWQENFIISKNRLWKRFIRI